MKPGSVEILCESALALAQSLIQNAINDAKHPLNSYAKLKFKRILKGEYDLTVKELQHALVLCGYEIRFERVPIQYNELVK